MALSHMAASLTMRGTHSHGGVTGGKEGKAEVIKKSEEGILSGVYYVVTFPSSGEENGQFKARRLQRLCSPACN